MADLKKWKPWYARIPGAAVASVGTVLAYGGLILAVPCLLGAFLMEVGGNMMKRKFPD